MTQAFTYFRPDGTREIRTQPEGPLPGRGEVWVRGEYPEDVPSPLNVRVGRAGIKVWMVIQLLGLSGGDRGRLRSDYKELLTDDDVDAAAWFYERNRQEIDARIQEEGMPV